MRYANRAKTIMGVWLAILIARPRGPVTVANARRLQRVGHRDARGPRGRNRRQDLHHQREHDDGKKSF
jgi:hypothetical protein